MRVPNKSKRRLDRHTQKYAPMADEQRDIPSRLARKIGKVAAGRFRTSAETRQRQESQFEEARIHSANRMALRIARDNAQKRGPQVSSASRMLHIGRSDG